MWHHVSVGNTRVKSKLRESCVSHNTLRAGASRAQQVRARVTVFSGLIVRRWMAICEANSSSLKTRSAMVVLERGRRGSVTIRRSTLYVILTLHTKFGWGYVNLSSAQSIEAVHTGVKVACIPSVRTHGRSLGVKYVQFIPHLARCDHTMRGAGVHGTFPSGILRPIPTPTSGVCQTAEV